MATELSRRRSEVTGGTVERNRRASRWVHASVYSLSLLLLATGLWLLLGQEGNPSLLARASGLSDAVLHRWLGYALAVVGGIAIVVWWRALRQSRVLDPASFRIDARPGHPVSRSSGRLPRRCLREWH